MYGKKKKLSKKTIGGQMDSWPDYPSIAKDLNTMENDLAKYAYVGKSRLDYAVKTGNKKGFIKAIDQS